MLTIPRPATVEFRSLEAPWLFGAALRTRRGGGQFPRGKASQHSRSQASSPDWLTRRGRRLHRRPPGRRAFEDCKRQLEREGLRFRISRLAGRIAERKIGKQEPGNADILDDILGAAHHDRGDPVHFEHTGSEADALLVTDRATGNSEWPSTPSALHRATISGQSISSVVRWLRFVGRPWKSAAQESTCRARPRRAAREAGNRCRYPRPWCACDRSRRGRSANRDPGPHHRIDGIELRGRIVGRPWTLIACRMACTERPS